MNITEVRMQICITRMGNRNRE